MVQSMPREGIPQISSSRANWSTNWSTKRRPSVGQAGLENSEIDRNRRDFVLTNPEIHHSSQDLGSSLALVTFSLVADKAIMEEP
jgi:hypothetical protein